MPDSGSCLTYELLCSKCGHTIYSGFDLKRPDEVLRPFGYRCGKCDVVLDPKNFKVEIVKQEPLNTGGRSDLDLLRSLVPNTLRSESPVKDLEVIA